MPPLRLEAHHNEIGGCDLAVHNTGIGMDEHEIPQALEPFRQFRNVHAGDKGEPDWDRRWCPKWRSSTTGSSSSAAEGQGTSAVFRLPKARLYGARAAG